MPLITVRYIFPKNKKHPISEKEYNWVISENGARIIKNLQKDGPVIIPICTSLPHQKPKIIRGYVTKLTNDYLSDCVKHKSIITKYNNKPFEDTRARLAGENELKIINQYK